MNKKNQKIAIATVLVSMVAIPLFLRSEKGLPIVAIANYGPHPTLEESINGLKKELAERGFVENKTIHYEIADVGFDHALIPQMISKLRSCNPRVMVVKSTPVAQFAKGKVYDTPLVYCDITDPVASALLKTKTQSNENITGSSDQKDFEPLLNFAKELLPDAKTVGVLYSTSDSNDAAMVKMMKTAAARVGLSVLAVPVDQSRDIPIRIQEFKGQADFIYVGTSGPIQPALPAIAAESQKMGIPLFNAGDQAVREGLALASFGVNYESVGRNAGKLVAKLLSDADIKTLAPAYPTASDHHRFVNKRLAEKFGIKIPENAKIVE
ncbi:MAG: ABC transporter substrate-binding protein [Holosporales bacterium]|jgi:putative ABC transport system substrate-binding protein|nr:ABC transporter substrate-binding protein [Holosporales bacterium]